MNEKYVLSAKMSWLSIEETIYMKDESTMDIYCFEDIAAKILKGICSDKDVKQIVLEIADYYKVEVKRVTADTKDFIGELLNEGIVKEKTR